MPLLKHRNPLTGSAYRFYTCGLDKPPAVSALPAGS
jgi:hypothetical protein